jgi:hypothetical protein
MSQFDFAFLAVQHVASESENICFVVRKKSHGLSCVENKENSSMEVDIPEEHAGVAACASSIVTTTMSSDRMDLDACVESVSQDIFEPTRLLTCSAAPKRFHRTFWRSAARRILALSSKNTVQDAA